jgi:hypothetical protein
MVITELHMDGKTEDKTFAPGYGEFVAGGGGELEAVALAVPVDAVGQAVRPELAELAAEARASFDAAGPGAGRPPPRGSTPWPQPGSGFAGLSFPSYWPSR